MRQALDMESGKPPSSLTSSKDRASQVDEKQEAEEEPRTVPAAMFVPAACMLALAGALTLIPHLPQTIDAASHLFTDQIAYKSIVIDGNSVAVPPLRTLPAETGSILRGTAACVIGFCIALLTVLRRKVRLGDLFHQAEFGVPLLREWQSGHPGDYVAWLTLGTAALGGCFVLLLR